MKIVMSVYENIEIIQKNWNADIGTEVIYLNVGEMSLLAMV